MIEKLKLDELVQHTYDTRDCDLAKKINELVDAVNKIMTWRFDCDDEIPSAEYVTIKEDDVYVGSEPATQYNGENIYRPYLCVAYFKEARDIIREEYGYELLELHCLQSSTEGEWAKAGNPTPDKNGTYSWLRAVYKDKKGKTAVSRWVFSPDHGSASFCASRCARNCGVNALNYEALRVGLFGSVAQ